MLVAASSLLLLAAAWSPSHSTATVLSNGTNVFICENYYRAIQCPLPDCRPVATFYGWRIAKVDTDTGKLTGVTSWSGGTTGGQACQLTGIGYNVDSEKKNLLLVSLATPKEGGSPSAPTVSIDLGDGAKLKQRAVPQSFAYSSPVWDAVDGFYVGASVDDTSPGSRWFSLYDATMGFDKVSHFATIDTKDVITSSPVIAQDWSINTFGLNVFAAVALHPTYHVTEQKLWVVHRINETVTELKVLDPYSGTGLGGGISMMFVNPNKDNSLVVLGNGGMNLFEAVVDVQQKTAVLRPLLSLPAPGALGKCKSFDKSTSTLWIGCETMQAIQLSKDAKTGEVSAALVKTVQIKHDDCRLKLFDGACTTNGATVFSSTANE